ncbi:MAG: PQQ-dependent sugar dehydrogenase [Longimicrobiales bacterium]|nr:PQQ-dependent sugar dehydrogenase [Longimicrobiales bacterium]
MSRSTLGVFGALLGMALLTGCDTGAAGTARAQGGDFACAPDDGGLVLPDGFCAVVVADDVGNARHMAVAPNGDLYVTLRGGRGTPGGAIALRDTTGDGVADQRVAFDDVGGTGIELWNGWVYVGHDDGVVRYRRPEGQLRPEAGAEVIVQGLRARGGHAAKPVEISPEGDLFLNIGSPSNSCQVDDRAAGSPGEDPCEERETNAAIWRFDAEATGQTLADGERVAAGMRNTVALHYDEGDGALYAAIHGRDQLHQNWEEHYTPEESAELPAEEFVRVSDGDDYGWPYCYYDHVQGKKVLAPEYGGTGDEVGRCADMDDPLVGFPGHWGPNDLLFYHGDLFPDRYRDGVFIAFHGSWNRAPLPQEGANVVFLPRENGGFAAERWEVFAEGRENWAETREHRPTGLAEGPDGSLYISDDAGGRIWRVVYRPEG